MNTFRRRHNNVNEYSGHDEASQQLRNRILNCVSPYIGQPSPYSYGLDDFHGIYRSTLNSLIDDEYGASDSNYFTFITSGKPEDVFTVVEIIITLGEQQLYQQSYEALLRGLMRAFELSGSVYEINRKGLVVLKLGETVQQEIDDASRVISKFGESKRKYQDAAAKLISRHPSEAVVQDAYLSLEMYIKAKTGEKGKDAFDTGVNKLLSNKPVQREIVKKLKGFKGNAKGISHDGSYVIDEKDAIWYVRSVGAVFSLIESEDAILKKSGEQE